jgi:hypothetical protein
MKSPIRSFYRHFHKQDVHKVHGSLTAMLKVNFEECTFTITFARCSNKDNFSRRMGREICVDSSKVFCKEKWNPGLSVSENIEVCLKNSIKTDYHNDREELKQIHKVFQAYKHYFEFCEWYGIE